MKTIICKIKSDGEDIKKTAILNDNLTNPSKSKKNEATDIIEPDMLDYEEWSVFFEITDTLGYEVVFEYDRENCVKTLKPVKAITWNGSKPDKVTITDVQNVTVIV